jgi:hypothetical protein
VNKLIAFLLFSIFFLVQAGPAVNALFSPSTVVMIIDEDKSPDKSGTELKKETKFCYLYGMQLAVISGNITIAFHCTEKLHSSPFLEIPGLPPDHC